MIVNGLASRRFQCRQPLFAIELHRLRAHHVGHDRRPIRRSNVRRRLQSRMQLISKSNFSPQIPLKVKKTLLIDLCQDDRLVIVRPGTDQRRISILSQRLHDSLGPTLSFLLGHEIAQALHEARRRHFHAQTSFLQGSQHQQQDRMKRRVITIAGDFDPIDNRVEIAAQQMRIVGGALQQAQQLRPRVGKNLSQKKIVVRLFGHVCRRPLCYIPISGSSDQCVMHSVKVRWDTLLPSWQTVTTPIATLRKTRASRTPPVCQLTHFGGLPPHARISGMRLISEPHPDRVHPRSVDGRKLPCCHLAHSGFRT